MAVAVYNLLRWFNGFSRVCSDECSEFASADKGLLCRSYSVVLRTNPIYLFGRPIEEHDVHDAPACPDWLRSGQAPGAPLLSRMLSRLV